MVQLPSRQIHLDFHTPAVPFQLGKNFDKHKFQETLQKAEVNSITLTGRCHHGHIYYDTKLPARHPQMEGDFLMDQVDACHEIGIRAPIYLTIGWDAFMADLHPEWLERQPNGEMYGFNNFGQLDPGWKTLCFNTPYLGYIKEQIKDIMLHFAGKLDGLFFDIVWQDPCSCNSCIKKMQQKDFDPTSLADRTIFARETEQFLKKEIYQTVTAINPECPIFFNEGNITPDIRSSLAEYSHLEIESLPSGEWGYQHFPSVVRYAKNLGKEYVGMTGKFHKVWADFGSYKNQFALEYECFLALAHGAKCSIGDQMYPDGTLQPATYELIGSVFQQVKEKEAWSVASKAVTEIAILHPGIVEVAEGKVDLSLAGAVNILNEAHYQFDIIDNVMDFSNYRLLVLPDKLVCNEELQTKLAVYLSAGGKIVATYKSGLGSVDNKFLSSWGIAYIEQNHYLPTYGEFKEDFVPKLNCGELVLHGPGLTVESFAAEVVGEEIRPLYNRTYQHYYSHFQAPMAEKTGYPVTTKSESVVYFTHPLFSMYKEQGVKAYKELVLAGIQTLLNGEKFVEGNFPSTADVILNQQKREERLVLNILHYIPERRSIEIDTIEEVIPLYQLEVSLNWKAVKKRMNISEHATVQYIKVVTNGEELSYEVTGDSVCWKIPIVKGHEMIEIKYQEG